MTKETNKLRALILSALMVFSVFAGTVALSGAAAANVSSVSHVTVADAPENTDNVAHEVSFNVKVDGGNAEDVDIGYGSTGGVTLQSVSSASANNSSAVSLSTTTSGGDARITVTDSVDDGSQNVTITVTSMVDVTTGATTGVSLSVDGQSNGASASGTFDVTASGVASSDYDVKLSSGVRTWSGQTLYYDTFESNDAGVELWKKTSSGYQFVTSVDVNKYGEAVFSVDSDQDTGDYMLVDGEHSGANDDNQSVTFQISKQTYSSTLSTDTVKNAGNDVLANITVNSNRNDHSHLIASPDLDPSEVQAIFGGVGTLIDTDGDGDNNYVYIADASTSDKLVGNFTDESTGNYTFNFIVPDTGVSTSQTVEVTEAATGQATFVTQAISDDRGDSVAVNVSITGASDTATVTFGGPSVNYNETITVTDGDNNGYVEIAWNTYLAGTGADPFTIYSDDDVKESTQLYTTFNSAGALSAGEYPVNATVGGTETGVATVVLGNPNDVDRAINVWTVPDGNTALDPTVDTFFLDHIASDDSIAMNDEMVLQIETAGVYGNLGTNFAAYTFGGSLNAIPGVSMSIEETEDSRGINEPATQISVTNRYTLATPGSNTMYMLLETENGNFTAGEEYKANLTFEEAWVYGSNNQQTTTQTFSVVERTANVDAPQDDDENPLIVEQSESAEITGTSSIAPGTNVTVTARSSGGNNPFLRTASATVQADGTWSTTLDVSDVPTGTNFSVSVKDGSKTRDSVNAQIGSGAQLSLASLDAPSDATPGETITVTATIQNTGGASGSADVMYMFDESTEETKSVSVDAGSSTEVTFEYTVPDSTGDYTHGVKVGDNSATTATITVAEDTTTTTTTTTEPTTAEPTDEPTTEMPGTDEPTTTEESGGTPGFGIAVALVALVAAAFLATRRDN